MTADARDAGFRALVEASAGAIFVVCDGTIVYANPALERLTGYAGHELVGMELSALFDPAAHDAAGARRAARERGEPFQGQSEIQLRTRTGQDCWIDVTTAPILHQGRPAILGTGVDVTSRKRLEIRSRQRQQLEATGRLAGGVAHDFNNLLLVIGGQTERLLEGLPDGHPLRASAEAIAGAADRAAVLTQQLLAIGRRQVLSARPLELGPMLRELEDVVRQTVSDAVIVVTVVAPDLPPVSVDRDRLEQALLTLAENARDAMGDRGGVLTLSADVVELDRSMQEGRPWLPGGTWVRLQVSDTGPGIPSDVMPRVFEPFFTTKGDARRSGLGLSTVYGIVKQSDGFIWIDNVPGAGARVTVILPPAKDVALGDGAPPPAAAPTHPRVLLVEDEEEVRDLLTTVLEGSGFEVTSAGSAEAALALLPSVRFEVLLTDVVLPGMHGPELARRVLAMLPSTRVLFMSGYTGDAVLDMPEQGGVLEFIQKPFASRALVNRLEAMLAR